nr:IclR family transcriptional regulator C-terminal domain-containing protein [Streptomyces bungoensis]
MTCGPRTTTSPVSPAPTGVVAAPVRGPAGEVVAAVSVVVPHETAEVAILAPAVRLAARGISRALGWRPGRPGR